MKKVLFLASVREQTASDPKRPVTIRVLTHFLCRPTEESFIHPRGLPAALAGARLIDCRELKTGKLELDFEPGDFGPESEIDGWTLIFPPVESPES